MSSDKPKHKPSPKHTLDEVLKSLHDLIRNDLVSANAATPASEHAPTPAPPAVREADEFNAALDELDEIITHKLIEPVEQAHRLPPGPPELVSNNEDALNEEEPGIDADPLLDPPDEDIVLESDPATESDSEPNDTPRAETQEAFSFAEPPTPDKTDEPFEPSYELVDIDGGSVAAPPPADDRPEQTTETPPGDWDDAATVDFDASPAPAESQAANAAPVPEPPAPPPAEPPPSSAASLDDIPVLHEVAHEILARADGAGLPPPERARAIAIQVIARLNIELRQSGRPPLDPRMIDRLQELLKHALAAGSPSDDSR